MFALSLQSPAVVPGSEGVHVCALVTVPQRQASYQRRAVLTLVPVVGCQVMEPPW
jgi:hypothetical protein